MGKVRGTFTDREVVAEEVRLVLPTGHSMDLASFELTPDGVFVVYAADQSMHYFPLGSISELVFTRAAVRRKK